VPSLVLVGELDRITPIAEAMSVRSLLKGELVVVPNVGHIPNVEDPIAFNEALAGFLGVELAPPPDADADPEAGAEAEAEAVAQPEPDVVAQPEPPSEPEPEREPVAEPEPSQDVAAEP
jgi:hypothetical protein